MPVPWNIWPDRSRILRQEVLSFKATEASQKRAFPVSCYQCAYDFRKPASHWGKVQPDEQVAKEFADVKADELEVRWLFMEAYDVISVVSFPGLLLIIEHYGW